MSARFSALNRRLIAPLAALAGLIACASDPAVQPPFEPLASYACEGGATVVTGETEARVLDGDDALRLDRTAPDRFAGEGAMVAVRPGAVTLERGSETVSCVPADALAGAVPASIEASGDAPAWTLTIDPDRMRVTRQDGAPVTVPTPTPRRVGRIATWTAEEDGLGIEARLSPGPCRQAEALPTPLNAEVTVNGRYYRGCSGDPAELLAGTWSVRGERGAVSFGVDGTLGVATGCNDVASSYEIADGRLTFGAFRQTRMACPGEAERSEERLLSFLREVDGFDVGAPGEIVLLAGGGTLRLSRLQQ